MAFFTAPVIFVLVLMPIQLPTVVMLMCLYFLFLV